MQSCSNPIYNSIKFKIIDILSLFVQTKLLTEQYLNTKYAIILIR